MRPWMLAFDIFGKAVATKLRRGDLLDLGQFHRDAVQRDGCRSHRAQADDQRVGAAQEVGANQREGGVFPEIKQHFVGVTTCFGNEFEPVPAIDQAYGGGEKGQEKLCPNKLQQRHFEKQVIQ